MARSIALLIHAAGAALLAAVASAAQEKPNIIFIMADDLGWRELGCYGQERIRTPNIDRMAAEGMRFKTHYSGAPVCAPARCTLMTGKHLGHAYVRDNVSVKPEGQLPIPDQEVTIAEVLKGAGYATGAMGKWGLGPVGSTGDPNKQGFDLFFGYNCQAHAHSYYPDYLWRNGERVTLDNVPPVPGRAKLPAGADPNDPSSYRAFVGKVWSAERIAQEALAFVRSNKDRPFFLYFCPTLTHVAIQIPDEKVAEYRGKLGDDPPYLGDQGYTPHPTPHAGYAAMVTALDSQVGRLLDLVRELGLDEKTIIFFTSDNGPVYGRVGGADSAFFRSAGDLRGFKGSVYEGGIREPLVVRWPGHVAAGAVSDHIGYFPDFLPTLAQIGGAQPPPGIDGLSMVPTLLGTGEQKKHPPFVWEFYGYGGQQAVRDGDWKAVRQECHKNVRGPLELYDLAKDPNEQNDVAAANPEVVRKMEGILAAEHGPSEVFQFGRRKAQIPER
ncbi:MAG TPA: arylsulfatase [Verrucomicrobiae bacterium]|nr:arylsulfatase [Verrucomicrobiae bacterium]